LIEQEEKTIEKREARSHDQRLVRQKPRNEQRKVTKTVRYGWINKFEHIDGKRVFNILSCRDEEDDQKICDYTWFISDGLNLCEETGQTHYQRQGGADGRLKIRATICKRTGGID